MKLSEFYRKTVDINDSLTGEWAIYYGVFGKIINDNNYKNIVEVGIGYGTHAKFILNNSNIDCLYLIDPIQYYENDGFATDIINQTPEIIGNNFNELHELITKELSPWNDKYKLFRTASLSVTNDQIKDNSVDCIFIDGDHSYEAVLNDLRFWWVKLKSGGQILGDDFWMDSVKNAVDKFSTEYNITYDLLNNADSDYKIYRFHKCSPKISLCITTMNRFDSFLNKHLEQYVCYLKENIVDEIIICDENGKDYDKIINKYGNIENLYVYKNDKVLGVFKNKIKVCKLAKYPYIALIDSDNFADKNYFINAKTFISNKKYEKHILVCPSNLQPHQQLNYTEFINKSFNINNISEYAKIFKFQVMLNSGNYILSCNIFNTFTFTDEFIIDNNTIVTIDDISGCDVIYFNLLVFKQFSDFSLYVVEKLEYEHNVHDDSEYLKKHSVSDNILYRYVIPELLRINILN